MSVVHRVHEIDFSYTAAIVQLQPALYDSFKIVSRTTAAGFKQYSRRPAPVFLSMYWFDTFYDYRKPYYSSAIVYPSKKKCIRTCNWYFVILYASKKTESQVDMKVAKRMTLFIIMIIVSRNGINAIVKNDPIKYLLKGCLILFNLQSCPTPSTSMTRRVVSSLG